jgi:hypothetical protein
MMHRLRLRGLPALLAALLLFAQQGALIHALGHAGHAHVAAAHVVARDADAHGHDAGAHDETPSRTLSELCAFDLVYSQVLGGVHSAFTPPLLLAAVPPAAAQASQLRGGTTRIPYDSRGPPAFS